MTNFDLSNRYRMSEVVLIEKYEKEKILTLLYLDGKTKKYFVKRFKIETNVLDKKYFLISEFRGSKLIIISSFEDVKIHYSYRTKNGDKKNKEILNKDVVDVKGWKSIGNRLDNKLRMSGFKFKNLELDKNENIQGEVHNENQSNDLENLTLF